VRFDYTGHGESGGTFEELTFTNWVDDALLVLDTATEGRQVLVGSSMGGWVALRLAVLRPGRLHSIVGVAAAPDFTEDLMWDLLDERTQGALRKKGVWRGIHPNGEDELVVTMALIESGRDHLMLRDEIAIDAPVRLLHGADDRSVPWETSLRLLRSLRSEDATLALVKGGHHRLSQPKELDLLVRTVDDLLAQVG
jgi:pimeloyl-ACP methyl ester carboxylesterase